MADGGGPAQDHSLATVRFGALWTAWPSEGRSALSEALGGSVGACLLYTSDAADE